MKNEKREKIENQQDSTNNTDDDCKTTDKIESDQGTTEKLIATKYKIKLETNTFLCNWKKTGNCISRVKKQEKIGQIKIII